jgi:hypothetical protein
MPRQRGRLAPGRRARPGGPGTGGRRRFGIGPRPGPRLRGGHRGGVVEARAPPSACRGARAADMCVRVRARVLVSARGEGRATSYGTGTTARS